MHSCIYEGRVTHCRYEPVVHRFHYPLYMVYLDLEELREQPRLRSLISRRRLATASFLEEDHLRGHRGSLRDGVLDIVAEQAGRRPGGPVRVLTQLRHCGYYFSPLNLFYCFDEEGRRVEAIVGEVNNTPWGEQHHYVLAAHNRLDGASALCFRHSKDFHVSPFLAMDYQYHWQLTAPDEVLGVRLENHRAGSRAFMASMVLRRKPLVRRQLNRALMRFPLMTAQIMAAIYYQAFRLWWKKCPVYSHPAKLDGRAEPHA